MRHERLERVEEAVVRVVETCTCGASIEIAWTEPKSSYNHEALRESERAKQELSNFRKAHKPCLISKAAGP